MSTHSEPLTVSDAAGMDRRVRVWDAFIRFFHWSVAIAFFVAYFTEDEVLSVHVWAGYTIGALVVLRIAWGFIGPRHARFSDFVTGPWRALRYLKDLVAGRAKRHLGHSPAGGLMVLLLLAGLLGTVWSGMELHALQNHAGPLAAITTTSFAGAGVWEEVHEVLANGVLTLVVLHVLGVILASVHHRENLVGSMLSGTKRTE